MKSEPPDLPAATAYLRECWPRAPRAALILGTGLGDVAREITAERTIPYSDIPGFPAPTAVGHAGRLICGELSGVPVVALQGRCHLYEGYSVEQVTLPVRALCGLGPDILVASNASGGLNPRLSCGDIVVVTSHINLMGRVGRRAATSWTDSAGLPPCCPIDRGRPPYDEPLADDALAVARRASFPAMKGVYVGVPGPNYETRAEYRFLRRLGGDVVGMSTIPEVLAATRASVRVLALSIVTNVARPDVGAQTTADEVVSVAESASRRMIEIVRSLVVNLRGADRA